LLNDIVENRYIPIIGAGFSRNAILPPKLQMPLWNDIGKLLAKQMGDYPYSTPIDAISAFCHNFSRAKLIEQLRAMLHTDVAQPGPAHIAFANLPFDVIVTTNFDFLVERAYDIVRRPYYPIVNEDQLPVSNIPACTRILKIHGDFNHPNRLILTEDDYDSFLAKYPLISTYLANLLILRTPLLIGYSLEDPDFRQIWQIIKARLGNLQRYSYTLCVGAQDVDVARYERRGVKVISLPGNPSEYGNILNALFQELRDYWLNKSIEASTTTTEEALTELSLPPDAKTRLCFVYVPYKLLPFYKNKVFPIVERYGFVPVTDIDIVSPTENIMAKIYSLIKRATLFIADIASLNEVFEVEFAIALDKKVIFIKEEGIEIKSMIIRGVEYIERPKDLYSSDISEFLLMLEERIQKISKELAVQLLDEPIRLLKKGEYRAAVISAIGLLEAELRDKLSKQIQYYVPLTQLLGLSVKHGYISKEKIQFLERSVSIRNKLLHTRESISQQEASQIVEEVINILQSLHRKEET